MRKIFYFQILVVFFLFLSCNRNVTINRHSINKKVSVSILIQKEISKTDPNKLSDLKSIILNFKYYNKLGSVDSLFNFYKYNFSNKRVFNFANVALDDAFFTQKDGLLDCNNCGNIKNWFKCSFPNNFNITDSVFIFTNSYELKAIIYNERTIKAYSDVNELDKSLKKCIKNSHNDINILIIYYFDNKLNDCDNKYTDELKAKISKNENLYTPYINTRLVGANDVYKVFVQENHLCNSNPADCYVFKWKSIPDFYNYELIFRKDTSLKDSIIFKINIDVNNQNDFCKGILQGDSVYYAIEHWALNDAVCAKYNRGTPCSPNFLWFPFWDIEVKGYKQCCDNMTFYSPSFRTKKNIRIQCH